MLTANLTIQNARRWSFLWRRRFVLTLPERWEEVQPLARRQRWWRWIMALPRPAAQRAMIRDLVPRRFRRLLQPLDFAALAQQLDWTHAEAQCEQVPMPHTTHKGIMYVFPKPKGSNVTALEFALCDDLYKEFGEGNHAALLTLSACIWRERDYDLAATLRRGDERVPLTSKEEAETRAARIAKAPPEMHLQALLWFSGLKLYVRRVYGNWLFEENEDDGEDGGVQPTNHQSNQSPNFGWWGVFLEVAETGVFGVLERVHQTSLHDICIYLVKKRVDANAMGASATPPKEDFEED